LGGKSLEEVEMAYKLYFYAVKFENRIPQSIFTFSKQICNKYAKLAKEAEMKLDNSDLFNKIFE
jgi:hypothetical protein